MKQKKPKPITIRVTQEDINLGVPGNAVTCPIAIAAVRSLGGYAEVSAKQIYHKGQVFLMPDIASQFVKSFDAGESVRPFSFPGFVPS